MAIDVQSFKGEVPRIARRLLGNEFAGVASNPRLLSGNLEPWKGFDEATTQQINSDPQTIYFLDDQLWLSWNRTPGVIGTPVQLWQEAEGTPFWDGSGGVAWNGNSGNNLFPVIIGNDGTTIRVMDFKTATAWTTANTSPGHPPIGDGLVYQFSASTGGSLGTRAPTTAESLLWPSMYAGSANHGGYPGPGNTCQNCYALNQPMFLPNGNIVYADHVGFQIVGGASGSYTSSNPALFVADPLTAKAVYDIIPALSGLSGPSNYLLATIPCADQAHIVVLLGSVLNGGATTWHLVSLTATGASEIATGPWTSGPEEETGYALYISNSNWNTYAAYATNGPAGMLESDLSHLWIVNPDGSFSILNLTNGSNYQTVYTGASRSFITTSPAALDIPLTIWADNGVCVGLQGNVAAAWARGTIIPALNANAVEADVAKASIAGDTSVRTYFCGTDCPRFTDLGLASGLVDGSGNPVTGSASVASGALPSGGPFPVYSRKLGVPNPTVAISDPVLVPAAPGANAVTITETFDAAVDWNLVDGLPGNGIAQIIGTGGDPGASLNTRAISANLPYGWKTFALDNTQPVTVTCNFAYQRNANDYLYDTTLVLFCSLDSTVSGSLVNILTTATGVSWSFQAINNGAYGSIISSGSIASGSIPTWSTADSDPNWHGPFRPNKFYTATVTITPGTNVNESTISVTIKDGATTVLTITSTANAMPNSGPGFGFGTTVDSGFSMPYWSEINFDNVVIAGTGPVASTASDEATTYLYTLVNDLGEESGPCPAMVTADGSGTITRPAGQGVSVTLPGTLSATGVDITYFEGGTSHIPTTQISPNTSIPSPSMNLYRAVTGSTGTAFLLVAANIAFSGGSSTTYTDSLPDSSLSEVLASANWYPPPTDMLGILALPNEIYAGFTKNQLCLSEQGIPHAWPIIYRLTFDYDMVGVGNIDNTVVACTKKFPWLCSGNTPDAYSQTKASYPYACASKRSIQFLENVGVVFATFEGLVAISGPGSEIVLTRDLFSKKEWEALNPSSMIGVVNDDRYFCFYDATSIGGAAGGFYLDLHRQSPYPGIPSIVSGKVSLNFTTIARYNDPLTDTLYITQASAPSIGNVRLLMHFDGSSPDFSDVFGHVVTEYGGSGDFFTGVPAKFGAGGLQSSNPADSLAITAPTTDFNFGTGDFTIELWNWVYGGGTSYTFFNYLGPTDANGINFSFQDGVGFSAGNGAGANFFPYTTDLSGAYHAIAWVRKSGVSTIYVDGVSIGTATDTSDYTNAGSSDPNTYIFPEHNGAEEVSFDELRISAIAQYSANYTPATSAFTDAPSGGSGGQAIVSFDTDATNPLAYDWRSKQFYVPYPTTLRMARITADSYANTTLKLYADGVLYATIPITSQEEFTLPQQQCLKYFEFELSGTDAITRAQFVEDAEEFD